MHDKTVVEGLGGCVGGALLGNRGMLGSSVALCLRVDGRHVAQAAIKAAHREEYALLRAGRELAPPASLQLLAQAEAWDRTTEALGGLGRLLGGQRALTCSASVATRHVEAVLGVGGVGVGVGRDLDAPARRLVGLSEVEAALEGALVV